MCVGTLVTKRPRPGSYRYTLKGQPLMKQFLLVFVLFALPAFGQSNYGEIRVRVTDPSGLGVRATVEIVSDASEYHNSLSTDDAGRADIERLPFGVYVITVRQPSFAVLSQSAEVRSALPMEFPIRLTVAAVNQSIAVSAADTLIDPDQAGSVNQIGSTMIQQRVNSLPGRSLQDLVNSQPGWLYEGNAVLHPRGSEYQTQFVVDGVPLTDNRSPSFGNEIEADDVQDMTIYTAGIPAEYGRKMGGVVEVNTIQDSQPGFHGQVVLSGGSFDSASSFAQGQYVWGQNTLGASASGAMTSHYLNPVVPANFTNTGTTGDLSVRYSREITPKDRLSLSVRHELARYQIPNEYVQQTGCYAPGPILPAPCQRQNANNIETMGIASYQHIFTSNVVANFHAMGRDNANDFYSNDLSAPIIVFQHNYFREAYFKGSITVNRGRHEFKAGLESDNIFLHENFNYIITDPTQFDLDTPLTFSFPPPSPSQPSLGVRPDLEQAIFVEDRVHIGNWSVSA
ncbi:MAG: TonB-dependent receptor plug domain-containing protein, partial [Candidatus Acidiferrales bacterium]